MENFFIVLAAATALVCWISLILTLIYLVLKHIKKDASYTLKAKKFGKIFGITIILQIIFLVSGAALSAKKENAENKIKKEQMVKTFEGKIEYEVLNKSLILTIKANVPDGAIFETVIAGTNKGTPDFLSKYITINNGIGKETFDIAKWDIGYLSALSIFRFNNDSHPQPDNIKNIYGEYGEKMLGTFKEKNNLNGYNGILKSNKIPYPTLEKAEDKYNKAFNTAINQIKKADKRIVIDIKEIELTENLKRVDVIIGDVWYNMKNYEKERLSGMISDAIKQIYLNTYKVPQTENVSVYFEDQYGKELATPKIFGGYEIKR